MLTESQELLVNKDSTYIQTYNRETKTKRKNRNKEYNIRLGLPEGPLNQYSLLTKPTGKEHEPLIAKTGRSRAV